MRTTLLLFASMLVIAFSASAQSVEVTFTHFRAPNRVEFDYTVLKPASFDPAKSYEAVFAFPSGDMGQDDIRWAADNYWGEAADRDWLIVIPTIPEQSWHTHPSHHALEAMMEKVKEDYKIVDGTFHLTGHGEGSRAAITYANMSRKYFKTFTVSNPTPWDRWDDRDLKNWPRLNSHMPVRILVGENDSEGMASAERVEKIFREGGLAVTVNVVNDAGKEIESLHGGRMLNEIAKNADSN